MTLKDIQTKFVRFILGEGCEKCGRPTIELVCGACLKKEDRQRERDAYWDYRRYTKKYRRFLASAKQRGLSVEMSVDEYYALKEVGGCAYCNNPITRPTIDRVDNNGIYELSNCVPACNSCNARKGKRQQSILKALTIA